MKALITGASSGIGRDIARQLSAMGYDIIAVARRRERLEELKDELKTKVEIVVADVTDEAQCEEVAKYAAEVDVFINNAGFGVFGEFVSSDLDEELRMLDTNVRAVHILTKHFVREFKKRNSGYILNVASLAAFFPGPLFASYYATKSYVLRLTQSIAGELRKSKRKVKISVPKVNFGSGTEKLGKLVVLKSSFVAKYAVKKMFSGKEVIVTGWVMKIAVAFRRILPDKILASAVYLVQSKKMSGK